MKWILICLYAMCVPVANWMIGNVGNCIPNGPCVIPVLPNLYAPSGVLIIGLALVLRDAVQLVAGWKWGLASIVVGTFFSYIFANPFLVTASVVSFALSELIDFFVYTPLAKKRLFLALIASGAIGAIVDSATFLFLAFGSIDYIGGQIIGKLYAIIAASLVILIVRPAFQQKET